MSGGYPRKRWLALAYYALQLGGLAGLTVGLHVNSIASTALGFALAGALAVAVRRDLWRATLAAGLAAGLLLVGTEYLLSYVVPLYLSRYWLLYQTPWGALILGRVPVTEAVWGTCFGLGLGPLYDACAGTALAPRGAGTAVAERPVARERPTGG